MDEKTITKISHDLKEPLTTIKEFSQLLLENYKDELGEDVLSTVKNIFDQSLLLENKIINSVEFERLNLISEDKPIVKKELSKQKRKNNIKDIKGYLLNIRIKKLIITCIPIFVIILLVADFYNKPILMKIIKISALNIILSSLCIVHLTMLAKELNFKKQTFINFASTATSGITGVILAYSGFEVWALVVQTLIGNIISTLGFWIFKDGVLN